MHILIPRAGTTPKSSGKTGFSVSLDPKPKMGIIHPARG